MIAASAVRSQVDVVMVMMCAAGGLRFHRDHVELAMAHALLGDQGLGKLHHLLRMAAQDHGLDAIVVIQMRVHGRDSHVVMIVLDLREPAGELSLVMVVDVTLRRHSMVRAAVIHAVPAQLSTQQIA